PTHRCPLEDGVAGIGRSGLAFVIDRFRTVITWTTDAAGIDDKAAIPKPDRTRQMRMSAKDQGGSDAGGRGLDFAARARLDLSIRRDPIQPKGGIVHRRTVTKENVIAIDQCRRQIREPVEVPLLQPLGVTA